MNGDISTVMSPRTVMTWAENAAIFNDIAFAFRVTFLNKCDELERADGRRILPALLRHRAEDGRGPRKPRLGCDGRASDERARKPRRRISPRHRRGDARDLAQAGAQCQLRAGPAWHRGRRSPPATARPRPAGRGCGADPGRGGFARAALALPRRKLHAREIAQERSGAGSLRGHRDRRASRRSAPPA